MNCSEPCACSVNPNRIACKILELHKNSRPYTVIYICTIVVLYILGLIYIFYAHQRDHGGRLPFGFTITYKKHIPASQRTRKRRGVNKLATVIEESVSGAGNICLKEIRPASSVRAAILANTARDTMCGQHEDNDRPNIPQVPPNMVIASCSKDVTARDSSSDVRTTSANVCEPPQTQTHITRAEIITPYDQT